MKINTYKHFLLDALRNLRRNRTLSTASAATVAASLFILGVFLLTILNVNVAIKDVESKVEVKVFLKEDIKMNEQSDIEKAIKDTAGVVDVTFESKNDALKKLQEQLGEENKDLVQGLEKDNPMPTSFIVKVEKPEMVTTVVDKVKGMPGIDSIKDGRQLVDKIMSVVNTIKWVGIAIFLLLIGVSLFLIGNTIKLTVYSRRREIGIMKYIGATDWFIRWPFIMEGVLLGVLGALLSLILLYFAYRFAYVKLMSQVVTMQFIRPSYVLSIISWEFLLSGILIGGVGSIMAIRKFLTV
ncbi:permease-like cell division protein FtsX [Clostridium omnivorum]|uniref:Cell division protein FtsX n=1 Tax=Clostridium omnivorum TaxID=1604902 RepID=A0ABQ5N3E4_9CLOT|nr:permease-like cell division protein FtsX [Clostridium sp. E14]GLC29664.1 cell division protein FtsX [Clostridium sp. E14]